jgi:hypothetical protein
MPITGDMLIGSVAVGPTDGVMRALDPAANAEIEPDFALGGAAEVDRAASTKSGPLGGRPKTCRKACLYGHSNPFTV